MKDQRRRFLKDAGLAGVAGIAMGAKIPTSAAQNAAEMRHPGREYDVRKFGAAGDGGRIERAGYSARQAAA